MSPVTWGDVENGNKRAQVATYARIEKVLGWELGTCREILASAEVDAGTTVVSHADVQNVESADLNVYALSSDDLPDMVVLAVSAEAPVMSEFENRQILNIVMESRRKRREATDRSRGQRAVQ